MDLLYIVLVIAFAFGLAILFRYLEKKGWIKSEDLFIVMNMFGLTTAIVKELNLKKEAEILKIGQVAYNTVEYIYAISQDMEDEELVKITNVYVEKQFRLLGIELTDNRRVIVEELIKIGLDNKLIQE